MKTLLFALVCLAAVTCQGQLLTSGPLVGTYIGIAIPAGSSCTTERLFVTIEVESDYTLTGDIVDWDNTLIFDFDSEWPWFQKSSFKTTVVPTLESGVRGSISAKGGSISGVIDFRPDGGCRYTFKAYRRFKNN